VRTKLLQDGVMSEATLKNIEEHLRYGMSIAIFTSSHVCLCRRDTQKAAQIIAQRFVCS
jgi:hypothetical protein